MEFFSENMHIQVRSKLYSSSMEFGRSGGAWIIGIAWAKFGIDNSIAHRQYSPMLFFSRLQGVCVIGSVRNRGAYSQHFIFCVTYEWFQ